MQAYFLSFEKESFMYHCTLWFQKSTQNKAIMLSLPSLPERDRQTRTIKSVLIWKIIHYFIIRQQQ